jgi:3'-phosphoadenosine 5'-phosphosulfate sulfotransferase (PAPS reductase)/FAD synthetase
MATANPYLLPEPWVLSFSGGRTSGYMLRQVLDAHGGRLPDGGRVIFCNTGKERPETLEFVERCSQWWGVDITWLEYRRWEEYPGDAPGRWACKPRKAGPRTGLQVVNFATASRKGEPFVQLIEGSKMLPNVAIRRCTQWLKIKTSWRYCRNVLGWRDYTNAIGLRADEPARVARLRADPKSTSGEEPVAPLSRAGVTLSDVREFWAGQPFDLDLQQHEGNCDLCFLKGQGKLLAILQERPDLAAWWIEQEQRFQGKTRLEEAGRFRKNAPSYLATLEMAQQPTLFDLTDTDYPSCRCTD